MSWYVVYTKPNNEKKVAYYLSENGINVYCPVYIEIKQWSDRKKKIEMPLFRSYVFVNLSDYKNESLFILKIPGVLRFVWWLGKPGIVKDNEIDCIKSFLTSHKDNRIVIDQKLNKGDQVNVKSGLLSGKTGNLLSVRGKNVVLEIKSLNCRLVATVELSNIELC